MRSRTYYRVRLAVRLTLVLALVALILWVSARVWWTGTGYCIGTLASCFH